MRADEGRIAAVARGYLRGRQLSQEGLAWLPEAVSYDVVQRAVRAGAFTAGEERWLEDPWLQKSLARHAVSAEIAGIAHHCLSDRSPGH